MLDDKFKTIQLLFSLSFLEITLIVFSLSRPDASPPYVCVFIAEIGPTYGQNIPVLISDVEMNSGVGEWLRALPTPPPQAPGYSPASPPPTYSIINCPLYGEDGTESNCSDNRRT